MNLHQALEKVLPNLKDPKDEYEEGMIKGVELCRKVLGRVKVDWRVVMKVIDKTATPLYESDKEVTDIVIAKAITNADIFKVTQCEDQK